MAKLKVGDAIPHFTLPDQQGQSFDSRQLAGQIAVIYFYPKDDTPGCTAEACSFRDQFEDFTDKGAEVIGISADTPKKHAAFAEKHQLPFTLLSDISNTVRKSFGVPKSMLGLVPGRVTYIVDGEGIIRHIFNSQFQPAQHVKESLKVIEELQSRSTTS